MSAFEPDEVLRFWFGEPGATPLANAARWFEKSDAFDREIDGRFRPVLETAVAGHLAVWRERPRSRLAFVILLDQFSRNMFRGTPRSFAQDALALETAQQALTAGDDRALAPIETAFLLMPLMHAEVAALQRQCVEGFRRLAAGATSLDLRAYFDNSLDFAERHCVIIERFGRFPHRNAILGRASTAEELAFLEQPGSSF